MSPRPDALDLRVDKFSDGTLLHESAKALLDPQRQEAAARLVHLMFPGWFISIAIAILVLAYFWQSGSAARLRDWLSRRFHQTFLVRFFFGASLALIARLAAFVPEFYIYRVQRSVGLSDQLLRAWGSGWLVNCATAMVAVGLLVAVALWIVDRTHQWYLYLIGAFVAFSLTLATFGPYVILPHFGYLGPLPTKLAVDAAQLEAKSGVVVPVVEHVDERSRIGNVHEDGLFFTERVIVGSTLIDASSERELRYLIAKELAFIQVGGPLRVAFFNGIFAVFGIALAVAIADRIGFRRDDDPLARLALLASLIGVVYLVVAPIDNGMLRHLSLEAESRALDFTRDRPAAVRAIIRTADQRLDSVCARGLPSFFLGRTEGPADAVALANDVPTGCP
jgi:hypothetical protein